MTRGIRSTMGGQFRDVGAVVDNDSENYEKNCQTAQELLQEAATPPKRSRLWVR